jgi:hypothetical protein
VYQRDGSCTERLIQGDNRLSAGTLRFCLSTLF